MNFFKSLSDIAEMAVAPVKKVAEEVCDLVDIEKCLKKLKEEK